MITKPTKPQESDLINLTAAAIVDFMSQIKKIHESEIKLQVCNISDMFKSAYKDVKFVWAFQELHVVYGSCLESSLKECKTITGQGENTPLEFTNMEENTPLPFKMKRFWACMKNKTICKYFQEIFSNKYQKMTQLKSYLVDMQKMGKAQDRVLSALIIFYNETTWKKMLRKLMVN